MEIAHRGEILLHYRRTRRKCIPKKNGCWALLYQQDRPRDSLTSSTEASAGHRAPTLRCCQPSKDLNDIRCLRKQIRTTPAPPVGGRERPSLIRQVTFIAQRPHASIYNHKVVRYLCATCEGCMYSTVPSLYPDMAGSIVFRM